MYTHDNDGFFPEDLEWIKPTRKYFKDKKLLLCPMASKPYDMPTQPGQGFFGGKFRAWTYWEQGEEGEEDEPEPYVASYGLNSWCTRSTAGGRTEQKLWKATNWKGLSRVPVLTDSAADEDTPLPSDIPPEWDGQVYEGGTGINEIRDRCINRHNGYINGVFADWHARKIGLKELWLLWWHRDWPVPVDIDLPTEWDDSEHWMFGMKNY